MLTTPTAGAAAGRFRSSLTALSKVLTSAAFVNNMRVYAIAALGKLLEPDSAYQREAAAVLGAALVPARPRGLLRR